MANELPVLRKQLLESSQMFAECRTRHGGARSEMFRHELSVMNLMLPGQQSILARQNEGNEFIRFDGRGFAICL
jgi:hypothetical protein